MGPTMSQKDVRRAHSQGYAVQAWRPHLSAWVDVKKPRWSDNTVYRIQPSPLNQIAAEFEIPRAPGYSFSILLSCSVGAFVAGMIVGAVVALR